MRVLLLTQWFDPEPIPKGLAFAKALKDRGFDVEVLTGFPNYPGGKLYPGYKMRVIQREVVDGVPVTRVPLYASHDQNALKRILNYVSFALTATFAGVFFMRRADVIYAYHPPLTVGMAAVAIRALRRSKVVYDIQDMWPDTLRATGMVSNPKILSVVSKVCGFVYRNVDKIVVLSPGFRRLLLQRGVPASKLSVVYNWCDEAAITSGLVEENRRASRGRFCVLFAGNMGRAQALDAVIDAAAIVAKRDPQVVFQFLGGGVEVQRLKARARELECGNVEFLPAVPMAEVGEYLNSADALLVHLKDDPLFEITIPSKTQAYMAAGKPVLMAVSGDAAELVTESGCGVTASPENAESIANAVFVLSAKSEQERAEMGRRGRDFYLNKLSFDFGVSQFATAFREVAAR